MLRMALSRAASGLLRALLERIGDQRDRILLSEVQSVDWQSLTFAGERPKLDETARPRPARMDRGPLHKWNRGAE